MLVEIIRMIVNLSALISSGYIELIDSNLMPIDLLYPMRLLLLAEFY
jgi:hypothetical protein